ncbi:MULTISPECIES: hypothetical protein [unclassified Ramlibacter]|uniref:hypothetical protein n=1 Tax=unclassified Ramlibacter TaxID=2617605 RepID=UPI00363805B5
MSNPATVWRSPVMSYADAVRLLNRRRKGADIDEAEVLKALELTGDYDPEAPPDYRRLWEVD